MQKTKNIGIRFAQAGRAAPARPVTRREGARIIDFVRSHKESWTAGGRRTNRNQFRSLEACVDGERVGGGVRGGEICS